MNVFGCVCRLSIIHCDRKHYLFILFEHLLNERFRFTLIRSKKNAYYKQTLSTHTQKNKKKMSKNYYRAMGHHFFNILLLPFIYRTKMEKHVFIFTISWLFSPSLSLPPIWITDFIGFWMWRKGKKKDNGTFTCIPYLMQWNIVDQTFCCCCCLFETLTELHIHRIKVQA